MTRTIEVSARTVEDAISKALNELNIARQDAKIEVLDEGDSGGLFGFGRKDASVRVSAASDEAEDVAEPTTIQEEETLTTVTEVEETGSTASKAIVREEGDQEEIEQAAVQFVAKIMQSLDIHGKMSSYFDEEGCLHLNIVGDNVGAAIGRRGETLDALEYLTILAVNKGREDYTRIIVDVGGYKERRIKNVAQIALRSADRVLRSGRKYTLKAMSSAERRQVHLALQDYAGVKTFSEGKDPDRRVVIYPDNED